MGEESRECGEERLKKYADKLSFEAEQKNNSMLLIKANSFRKTATEKAESISVLDKAIVTIQEEKENMKILIGFKQILVALITNLYSAFHQTNASDVMRRRKTPNMDTFHAMTIYFELVWAVNTPYFTSMFSGPTQSYLKMVMKDL